MSANFFKISKGVRIVGLASDPSDGEPGSYYYNTTSNTFRYYNGTTWSDFSGGGGTSAAPAGTGDDLDSLQYNASFNDNFTDLPSLPKVLVTLGELVGLPKELLIELLNFILPV